jgi:hypothetical protein
MMMKREQRIIKALRDKFPGDITREGINYSHASKALGATRQAIMNWTRDSDKSTAVDIRSSNWAALAKVTGYSRDWLEHEIGPEKALHYEKPALNTKNLQENTDYLLYKDKKNKWSELGSMLDSLDAQELNKMPSSKAHNRNAFAVTLDSNQFAPYAVTGETIVIDPRQSTHARKVVVKINGDFYILIHNKLLNSFTDLTGNPVHDIEPEIIGAITQIYGAVRSG